MLNYSISSDTYPFDGTILSIDTVASVGNTES